MSGLTDETRRLLAQTSTATLATQLFKRGLRNTFLLGVSRLNHDPGPVMVGEAYTLRYIPAREDLNGPGEYGDHHPQRRAIEECPPGAVLVADCRRDVSAASGGDILMTRLAERGVGGMVTDGGMRDVANIAKLAMPVYIGAPSAPASFHRHAAVDANVPIACGGVPVYPGDVMVGDRRRRGRDPAPPRRRGRRRCRRAGAARDLDPGRGQGRQGDLRPLSARRRDPRPLRRLPSSLGDRMDPAGSCRRVHAGQYGRDARPPAWSRRSP